ncbi:hypothetical protein [Streptomyces sp. NPDC002611]
MTLPTRPCTPSAWGRTASRLHGFTVDSLPLLQTAAPRDAFATGFPALSEALLLGPPPCRRS